MGYKIRITTSFEEFWRYNVALCCGCFNEANERIDFVAGEDTVAAVGSALTERPEGIGSRQSITFETPECHALQIHLYILPHSLPRERTIEDTRPFNVKIEVLHNKKCLYTERHSINQWSGDNLLLNITSEE